MGSQLVISAEWLDNVKNTLAIVETSGQAFAAIWAAKDFADEASSAVKAGDSWFFPDPWRTDAARALQEAAILVSREEKPYRENSTTAINRDAWAKVAAKISNLYALAQITRQGFPSGVDTTDYDSTLLAGAAYLVNAIAEAPKAVVSYVVDTTAAVADKVTAAAEKVATKAVRGVVGVAKEAASGVADVAESAIPWKVVLGAVGIIAVAVGGVVLLSRSGALGGIKGIVHG